MKTSPTPVVSDADVLIHLAKLGKLPLLRALYERVSIPEYVRQEITSKDDHGITEAIGSYLIVHRQKRFPSLSGCGLRISESILI